MGGYLEAQRHYAWKRGAAIRHPFTLIFYAIVLWATHKYGLNFCLLIVGHLIVVEVNKDEPEYHKPRQLSMSGILFMIFPGAFLAALLQHECPDFLFITFDGIVNFFKP